MAKHEHFCSMGVAKSWLFVFIMFLWVVGSVLVSFGIVVMLDTQRLFKYLAVIAPRTPEIQSVTWLLNGFVAALIVIGTAVLILGLLGCFVVAVDSLRVLCILFVSVLFIMFSLLALCAILIVNQPNFRNIVERILEAEQAAELRNGLLLAAHEDLACCGIRDTPFCTQDFPPGEMCHRYSLNCRRGCLDEVWLRVVLPKMRAFMGVALCSSVLLLLCASAAIHVYWRLFTERRLNLQTLH